MTSEGKSDPAWQYCTPLEGNKYGTICNFCGNIMKSGGITRFKFHLAGNDPRKNSKQCPNVPPEVRKEIVQLLRKKEIEKKKKRGHV